MSRARARRAGVSLLEPHRVALAAILAGAALLEFNRLSQNGYANVFYAAGVKSMLHSLHNFLFVSFDPGGLVMIDKPPLALWLQTRARRCSASRRCRCCCRRRSSRARRGPHLSRARAPLRAARGARGGARAGRVPSFVAVSRENGVDTLMIVLMLLACGAALRAIESARLRDLCASAAFVGLAFNTKALAGLLVVPAIVLGYAVCAPGSSRGARAPCSSPARCSSPSAPRGSRRRTHARLSATVRRRLDRQHRARPHVRIQRPRPRRRSDRWARAHPAGSGAIAHTLPGSRSARAHTRPRESGRSPSPAPRRARLAQARTSRRRRARALARRVRRTTGSLRLFGKGLGDQGAWLVPLALIGMFAYALTIPRARALPLGRRRRRRARAFRC